ncbi:hypothetical protein GCM10010174_24410 [Kutzneria viridogrisea]|uniref:phosphotransferase n=1 Tax=Kutzneria viridogrisea TaxID=47990 RepID=UPI0031FA1D74
MPRREWEDLPAPVRLAVEDHCGTVTKAEYPTAGTNSDFSATLRAADGPVFVKGVQTENSKARMHRHEALVNPFLPPLAPRLLWRVERDGWLLLGFERATGQHANLSPGSPDLPSVAGAAATLAQALTPCPLTEVPELATQWQRLSAWRRIAQAPGDLDPWAREHLRDLIEWESRAIELVVGDSLIHTDLHPLNILVDHQAQDVSVIDWAWSRRGPAWVDAAFLVVRLINEGHTITEAERWASDLPVWEGVPDYALTAFAAAVTGIWEHRTRLDPKPFRSSLTESVRMWAQHRM